MENLKEFLKKHWIIIGIVINYLVILVAYSAVYDKGMSGIEVILGLWIFISAAFGMYKLFKR